jgi:hypothetical protein
MEDGLKNEKDIPVRIKESCFSNATMWYEMSRYFYK